MKVCPYCAEDIQDAAIVCKHCGRDLTPSDIATAAPEPHTPPTPLKGVPEKKSNAFRSLLGLLAVLGIPILVVIYMLNLNDVDQSPAPRGDGIAKSRDLLTKSLDAGMITRYSCTGNEVYVHPGFWVSLDADGKRGLTLAVAAVCEGEKSGNYITVFDSQSGQKLASFSGSKYQVE